MHTAQLLKQTTPPNTEAIVSALHQDALALSAEWSRGDVLSMISDETVAKESAARVLLLAAAAALRAVKDPTMADMTDTMAKMLEAYLSGRLAEKQFCFRDRWTADALETAADDMTTLTEEIADRFRADAEGLAA